MSYIPYLRGFGKCLSTGRKLKRKMWFIIDRISIDRSLPKKMGCSAGEASETLSLWSSAGGRASVSSQFRFPSILLISLFSFQSVVQSPYHTGWDVNQPQCFTEFPHLHLHLTTANSKIPTHALSRPHVSTQCSHSLQSKITAELRTAEVSYPRP